ncbi:hypothetical protein J4220_03350 [Candidatus Micrarchaeota archaeon]|nr:hypothetical protein [Candidatus Micrarchaeota archaeon]
MNELKSALKGIRGPISFSLRHGGANANKHTVVDFPNASVTLYHHAISEGLAKLFNAHRKSTQRKPPAGKEEAFQKKSEAKEREIREFFERLKGA